RVAQEAPDCDISFTSGLSRVSNDSKNGINILDSPRRNPKGWQKVAGGRSPRRPPEKSLVMTAPRRGARRQVNAQDLYSEGSGTPPGCDPINLAFPVVSAHSDHRLLSLQPFGLLRWVLLIVAVESGARRPCTTSWKTYEFPAHTRVASQTDGFGR